VDLEDLRDKPGIHRDRKWEAERCRHGPVSRAILDLRACRPFRADLEDREVQVDIRFEGCILEGLYATKFYKQAH